MGGHDLGDILVGREDEAQRGEHHKAGPRTPGKATARSTYLDVAAAELDNSLGSLPKPFFRLRVVGKLLVSCQFHVAVTWLLKETTHGGHQRKSTLVQTRFGTDTQHSRRKALDRTQASSMFFGRTKSPCLSSHSKYFSPCTVPLFFPLCGVVWEGKEREEEKEGQRKGQTRQHLCLYACRPFEKLGKSPTSDEAMQCQPRSPRQRMFPR
eukprot:scaffold143_cov260-Pinguiococcus_pyrenoidosus.AAC.10